MKILFITGHRKSGTKLLTSLFDDHDAFAVYPTDLSIMYAYFPYFNNTNYTFSQKIERIKKILKLSLKKNFNYRVDNKKINIKKFINSVVKKLNKKNINNIKTIKNHLKNQFTQIYNLRNKKFFFNDSFR